MSRLSRANLRGRDSVFAGGPDLYRGDIQAICPPSLEECVMIMEDCCEEVALLHPWRELVSFYLGASCPRVAARRRSRPTAHESGFCRARGYSFLLEMRPFGSISLISRTKLSLRSTSLSSSLSKGSTPCRRRRAVLQSKVDTAQSRTSRPTAGAPPSQEMEARRLQALTKQREALENEIQALEEELDAMAM
ncbi:hypothetical protein C8J57DRAFT_249331 [Mycena rebaudengoi]|nr:hypothetical protein C8J57DRAFT_249331 [Mycena rebaudengoi]